MPVNEQWLEFAFWMAGANWLTWRADFEFEDDVARLPVLQRQDRYRVFIKSYSLLRYYTSEERNSLRQRLYDSNDFRTAVAANDGTAIDDLAHRLRAEFPDFDVERSFLSKLAAFAKPTSFIAWDRFARRGVAALANGPTNGNYQTYSAYLMSVNGVLAGQLGQSIQAFINDKRLPTQNREAFVRRVLDVYLMAKGGRWATELT